MMYNFSGCRLLIVVLRARTDYIPAHVLALAGQQQPSGGEPAELAMRAASESQSPEG